MTIIELEDCGQDFTEFYVNDKNVIVEARPFQTWVWGGMRIAPDPVHDPVHEGMKLKLYKKGSKKPMQLRYRVIGVRTV